MINLQIIYSIFKNPNLQIVSFPTNRRNKYIFLEGKLDYRLQIKWLID